jgi:hypothetical protein
VRELAARAEIIVLAVPYGAIDDVLRELGDAVEGKVLVDVTNALTKLTVFAASDDDAAKRKVLELATSTGFDAVDAGALRNARLLEPMPLLSIRLGYDQKMGTNMGLRLVH